MCNSPLFRKAGLANVLAKVLVIHSLAWAYNYTTVRMKKGEDFSERLVVMFATLLSKACDGITCVHSTDGQLHAQIQPKISLTWDIVVVCASCFILTLSFADRDWKRRWWLYQSCWSTWCSGQNEMGWRWGGSCNLLSFFFFFLIFALVKNKIPVLIDERTEVSKGGYGRRGILLS